ncbi:hypothetical protein IAQ61_008120 [Plenodomus lingam]|uniref:uncharacterized protein n=1 Tax=Leptosphaeria maculans TaxID=5022 RepID=UPI00333382D0|nr:hypothetical protein IAQ61_008120 [Plenodomus lingam]
MGILRSLNQRAYFPNTSKAISRPVPASYDQALAPPPFDTTTPTKTPFWPRIIHVIPMPHIEYNKDSKEQGKKGPSMTQY